MQVNFYLSNLNSVAKKAALTNIKNINNRVIVLTPDRNTLNVEKELFQILNKNSLFNVDVMTFSRLAKGVLQEKGLYRNILTKHAGVALVKKILLDAKDELGLYKKAINKLGFAEKVFETIQLYKSCRISPEQLHTEYKNTLLSAKLRDLKIIYQKYEEALSGEYTDNFNLLDIFEKKISKEDFSDCDIFLVDYEDITPHMSRIVAKLAKTAKSLNVCTTYSKVKDIHNEAIYNNELLYNLNSVFETNGIKSNKILCENDNQLSKYLFSNKQIEVQGYKPKLKLFKANNISSEIKSVLANIKKDILDGKYEYNDVAFVVSNLSVYKNELIENLLKFDIPFYLDETKALSSNLLSRIVMTLCEILANGVDRYSIIELMDSGICGLTNAQIMKYKDYILTFNATGEWLYSLPSGVAYDEELDVVFDTVRNINDFKVGDELTFEEYKSRLFAMLQKLNFDKFYEVIYSKFIDCGDVENARHLTQAYDKLSTVWTEMDFLFACQTFKPEYFNEIVKSFIEDIKLSLPPLTVNSLVVSEFESCMVEDCKVIYFVGAADGELPKYNSETALINDKEMKECQSFNKLNPTINLINKRKKFKLFELLFKAKDAINFSYVAVDSKGEERFPCVAYSELQKYLSTEIESCEFNMLNIENVVKQNITEQISKENIIRELKNWNVYNKNSVYRSNVTSVYHVIDEKSNMLFKNLMMKNNFSNLKESDHLYFKTGKVSPSQFETFSRCPYMHFVRYGIKVKDKQKGKLAVNDIGDILHDYLSDTIYDLNNYKNDDEFKTQIKVYAQENLTKVLNNPKYNRFLKSRCNINVIHGLYSEVVRLTEAIIYQLSNSEYEPYVKEYAVGDKNKEFEIVLNNGKKLVVYGKIDRVDVNKHDNSFYILDYKTGAGGSFGNFDEVAIGKKIQLVLYLMLYSRFSGFTPVGAFYIPVQNKLSNGSADTYRYNGFFIKNVETLEKIDNKLKEFPSVGGTLRLKRKNDGQFYARGAYDKLGLSFEELNKLFDQVEQKLVRDAQEICNGCIEANPLLFNGGVECQHCKYIGLCNFNRVYGNTYRKIDK